MTKNMNYRVIELAAEFPDVLLYRDRDENGKEMVKILAIGTIDSDGDMWAGETIVFEDSETAQDFIRNYTELSAAKWCQRQKISY